MTINWDKITDCLATKGVVRIITYLVKEKEAVNLSQLNKSIPTIGKQAINTAILCLILNGLLEERREPAHNQRLVILTSLGEKIGKYLNEMPKVIKE